MNSGIRIIKNGQQGFILPDLRIGLDTGGTGADHFFISHAHSDHVPGGKNLTVTATPPTADLLRVRGFKGSIIELEFYDKLQFEELTVSFYPAGHILGSAMVYVECDRGNILYTGDFRTPPSPASEGFDYPANVDVLITEATFSLPLYRWKSHSELYDEIRNFATFSLNKGDVPVFVTYTLGKAQEVMMALAELEIPMQLHDGALGICDIYEKYGYNLGKYGGIDTKNVDGNIVIVPMPYLTSKVMQSIANKRVAWCTGWAEIDRGHPDNNADAMISLSDHLDFFELIGFCERLSPAHVVITHTPDPAVVGHYLDGLGISYSHEFPVCIKL